MPKQNLKKSVLLPLRAIVLTLVLTAMVGGAAKVHADQFDDQINALRAQNSDAQGALNGLSAQAGSYQEVINQLQAQINGVQAQIAANQALQAQLQGQITEAQAKIDAQKKYLGDDIRYMYENGQLSTIEELATSKNLSDYVDQEEYRITIQNKVNDLIKQIADLQAQLQRQKGQLDTLVESEKQQNDQLASAQAQQQQLLSFNQSQQAAYNGQIAANSGKIGELRRQQAILNARYNIGDFKGDPNNGGYPSAWANAGQDTLIDSWGMYNRECVSYTAFRVHQDYLAGKNNRDMPYWGGVGNANQWDDNARAAGIPVDGNPTPGSIAISNAGAYGHAMYVEAVNGNQIYVQQYNQQLDGRYSEGWRYTTGLVFLHF
ncbi:MAG: hypothetical protein JWL89_453 [Candidatus Saccharibacteria bacterium]|nr:hypothetical protein [Candidatus Saccharibacteria bacterium]